MLNTKGEEGGRRGQCEQRPAIPCQSLTPAHLKDLLQVLAVPATHSPTTHTSAAQGYFQGPGSAHHCPDLPAPAWGDGPQPIPRHHCIPQ